MSQKKIGYQIFKGYLDVLISLSRNYQSTRENLNATLHVEAWGHHHLKMYYLTSAPLLKPESWFFPVKIARIVIGTSPDGPTICITTSNYVYFLIVEVPDLNTSIVASFNTSTPGVLLLRPRWVQWKKKFYSPPFWFQINGDTMFADAVISVIVLAAFGKFK